LVRQAKRAGERANSSSTGAAENQHLDLQNQCKNCEATASTGMMESIAEASAREAATSTANSAAPPVADESDSIAAAAALAATVQAAAEEEELLLFKNCTLETLLDPLTWQRICPFLTCNIDYNPHTSTVNSSQLKGAHAGLCNKGYFQINPSQMTMDIAHANMSELLSKGVLRLMEMGYSPCFLLMYNEAWALSSMMGDFMSKATEGRNFALGDFYVFAVLSAKQKALAATNPNAFVHSYAPGPPHRDRPDSDASSFFSSDVCPHYVSTWMALTTATTANSCLYCVPLQHDKGYYSHGDAREHTISLQHVLAKPLRQGAFLAFSHRLLHWGGSLQQEREDGNEGENKDKREEGNQKTGKVEVEKEEEEEDQEEEAPPRIAFTNAYAASAFELPYFDSAAYPLDGTTPLGLRLGLSCGQQIQYEHLRALAKYELALLRRVFHSQKAFFSSAYFEKISSSCQMLTFMKRQQGQQKREPLAKV